MNADGNRRALTIALLAQILETDAERIRDTDRLRDDLGLDSLQSLELLSRIAEELRIDLPMEEAMELDTVEDACRFVEQAWQARPADPRQAGPRRADAQGADAPRAEPRREARGARRA